MTEAPMRGSRDVLVSMMTLAVVLTAWAAAADRPDVRLDHDPAAGTVDVHVRGEFFTTYSYGEFHPDNQPGTHTRTPILWPVKGEGGVGLTRNFPMGENNIQDTDHPHHRSLFFTFGDVNGYDQWHRETIHTERIETGTGDGYAWLRAYNDWLDAEGEPILHEVQELRFHDHPASGRRIDLISTLKAKYGPVTFGDDKEGMIGLRIRPEIRGVADGVLTNARGEQGESNVYGTPAPWMDYAGPIDGYGWRGIAIFDHPDNFRPGYWHVRDYGLMGLNPFGKRDVGGLDQDGAHQLGRGDALRLRYAWFIHSGDHEEADVAGEHARFVEEVRSTAAADESQPINAFYVTGGGWHDYEVQEPIVTQGLAERLDIEWTIENQVGDDATTVPDRFRQNEDWMAGFDVVVYNMCMSRIEDPTYVESIGPMHEQTGVPAVLMHCAIHSFRHSTDTWHEFAGIVSRQHEGHRPFHVEPLEPDHPAMAAFPADGWTTPQGELYIIDEVDEERTNVLARAWGEDTEQHHPVIWATQNENTRVFGTTIGHHNETMEHPVYLDLIANGLRWALDSK